MVVEIRPQAVHKGLIARALLAESPALTALAIGDDATDEDLFAALPADALTVHVGPRPSIARYRVDGTADVRRLLTRLADAPARASTARPASA